MKPKKRSIFSPTRADSSSRSKKRKYDRSPPRRRTASERRPPPEFKPLDLSKVEHFSDLLDKDKRHGNFTKNDLKSIQCVLEKILAHAAFYNRRSYAELEYLNTGEYVTEDLMSRPCPQYELREAPETPTISTDPGICALPSENEAEDDFDVWPPSHIPTRFWTWCKHNFMQDINVSVLKEYKRLFMNEFCIDFAHLMVNEPWKHRTRNGKLKNHSSPATRRKRSSCDDRSREPVRRSARQSSDRVPACIENIVGAVCREIKDERGSVPPSPFSHELPFCFEDDENKLGVGHDMFYHADGESKIFEEVRGNSSPLSPRSTSARVKKEVYEEYESEFFSLPHMTNGASSTKRKSFDLSTDGEIDRTISSPIRKIENEIESQFSIYKDIGEKVVKHLISNGLVPEYANEVFGHMKDDASSVQPSTEGKELEDVHELDEVSEELLKCQQELKEMEPDLKGIVEHCWFKLKKDFAYHHTASQLNDADYDLFRLGVNFFKDNPKRRPTRNERPTLDTAILRRNKKARDHYGRSFRRLAEYANEHLSNDQE